MQHTLSLLFGFLFTLSAIAEDQAPKTVEITPKAPVTREASVTIGGKKIDYSVTTSELALANDQGDNQATVFHVSYLRKDVADPRTRPVLFAFNGGPGSSSVWLHLGALGPRIIPTSPDGTQPLTPPVTVVENPHSILDVTDIVFVDPVSTGLSRPKDDKTAKQFYSIKGDLDSMSDFIRRWVTENHRWGSPKYLLGESYGSMRVAGLSDHLQQRYGMQLNGVILLSGLLDFQTLDPAAGNDLPYLCYLPSLVAAAHFHGKTQGDLDKLLAEAQTFCASDYLTALHRGHTLDSESQQSIAKKLSELTGLDSQWILENHLRISPTKFRQQLLKAEGKCLGRFDARVAWDSKDSSQDFPNYDPAFSVVQAPITTAMLDYLTRDLGWDDTRVYEIISGKVQPWDWNAQNSYFNISDSLGSALEQNPRLRVLVQCGRTDLATPAAGILYSLDHLLLSKQQRARIRVDWYDAGHMFYLNQPDLEKMRRDLVDFISQP